MADNRGGDSRAAAAREADSPAEVGSRGDAWQASVPPTVVEHRAAVDRAADRQRPEVVGPGDADRVDGLFPAVGLVGLQLQGVARAVFQ